MAFVKQHSLRRKVIVALVIITICLIASIAGALALVHHASTGRLYDDVAKIPHRHVGLVLGCSRLLGDGAPNPFFKSRIQQTMATLLRMAGRRGASI